MASSITSRGKNCPVSATGSLREIQTGRAPTFGTTVKTAWIGNDLYFAIRCDEHRGEKLNIAATKKDDAALWYGDALEILIETDVRSYYQIAISQSGSVADLDRSAARNEWFSWDSQAEVATQIADDHWTAEIRIPVTKDENDPLHQVIGRYPTASLPWHINVCRQRIRDHGAEHSAFSPTGASHFHDTMKFANFFGGRSHEFESAAPDADFLNAMRSAADLARTGKREEALSAYTAAAEGKITDLQTSHALEQAAATACGLRKNDIADQLAARIPIDAVKKTAQMQSLLESGKAQQVIVQFAGEDIAAWPFWKRGDGYFARGRAYVFTNNTEQARADLTSAIEWLSDARSRKVAEDNLARLAKANR